MTSLDITFILFLVTTSDDGQDTVRNITTKKPTCKKSPVVLPYIKGVSEQIRRVFKQYDVPAYFKPMNNLRQLLVRPKATIMKEGVIGALLYRYIDDKIHNWQCGQ